jgi:sterol desaturase/sphingolipid hydroxylase (fatty acid hydroxylase superfamily)
VHAVFLSMVIWVMPLYGSVIYIFLIHMIVRNVLGHTGLELFPCGFVRLPLAGGLTTVIHHDMHHSNPSGNFALYFTWWDRIIGTEHADYGGAPSW